MSNHVILNFVFFSFVHYITFVLAIPTIKPTVHPRQLCVLACTRLFALSNIMSKIRIFLWCPYKEVRTQDFSAQCYRQLSSLLLMQFQVLPVRRLITYGPLPASTRTGPAS